MKRVTLNILLKGEERVYNHYHTLYIHFHFDLIFFGGGEGGRAAFSLMYDEICCPK